MLAPIVPTPIEFVPGERARLNGVYRVTHDGHREAHTVTVLKGDEFPRCKKCGDRVRYQLWFASDYLTQGWERRTQQFGIVNGGKSKAAAGAGTQHSPGGGRVHSVHIYSDDLALITRLCGIVSTGLKLGDSVVIVGTAEHRASLVSELRDLEIDVREYAREGRFVMADAGEALSTFMVGGMPDAELFSGSIGKLLEDSRSRSLSNNAGITVFGEMVAVLWDQGNKEGALALEEMWNAALNQRAFHLHCAYPRSGFIHPDDEARVCHTHSHVVQ